MDKITNRLSDVGIVGFDDNSFNNTKTSKENVLHGIELSKHGDKTNGEEYDPYEHRNVAHPITNTDTMIHLLKGSLGTGILAMPNAFNNSGYIVGIVGTVLIACICTYAIHLLLQAEYELCKRKKVSDLSYSSLGKAAVLEGFSEKWGPIFAPYFGYMITIFLFIYQIGSCCVYIIFITSNIKSILDTYNEVETDIRLIMLIILVPLILMNWVRNLKYLAPFSTFANIITFCSFGIICYYIFRDPITFVDRKPVGEMKDIALYFGTVLFALEAIGVMLPLRREMKTPKSFGGSIGILNQAMAIISILYICLGLFGYLHFGAEIQGSITLNLPAHDILSQSVKGLLAFAICLSYTIQYYVAIDILWANWLAKRLTASNRLLLWEYVTRTCVVLMTFVLAVIIPNLELYISLFGALCLATLGLAFPPMIQLLTFWPKLEGKEKFRVLVIDTILIISGITGFAIGTYTSLSEIIKTFFE